MQVPSALRRQFNLLGCFSTSTTKGREIPGASATAAASRAPTASDKFAGITKKKPAGRASALAAPTPSEPTINWHSDVNVRASRFGANGGAHFVSEGANSVVVKWGSPLEHEVLGYHLASHLGLSNPFLRVEASPTKPMRNRLGSGDAPVMLLREIKGNNFAELTEKDEAHIKQTQGHPHSPLREVGRLVAFDYFLQNHDRFPLEGLHGNNPANLVLSGGKVHAIDHTLPKMIAETETRRYRKVLATALELLRDPDHADAEACLHGLVKFFPQEWGLSWEAIRKDVVAGFVHQAHQIGRMSDADLKGLFQKTKKHKPLSPQLEKLLIGHLDVFRDATLRSVAL